MAGYKKRSKVPYCIQTAILLTMLAGLAAIDIGSMRLPDIMTIPLLLLGLVSAGLNGGPGAVLVHDAAALAGLCALWAIAIIHEWARGRPGLGLGDAKLLAAAGAWLGPWMLAPLVLLASTTALIAVTSRTLLRSRSRPPATAYIAFGPHLSAAFAVLWLVSASPWGDTPWW